MDEKSVNTRQLNRPGEDMYPWGENRNRWKESGSRNKKVSTESNLPCLPPSMLRHTKEADPMGPVATELQIHPVTASEI